MTAAPTTAPSADLIGPLEPGHQGGVLGHVVRRGAEGVGLFHHGFPGAGDDHRVRRRAGVAAGGPVDVHGGRVGHNALGGFRRPPGGVEK